MSKEDIRYEMNIVRNQLSQEKSRLKELNEKSRALEAFASRAKSRAEAFEASVSRRKNRLSVLESFTVSVRAIGLYRQKMNDMLTGTEFRNAQRQITEMMDTISTQRRKINSDILSTEDRITSLQRRYERLSYQYNTYPEEAE